jgi:hypothetical protein
LIHISEGKNKLDKSIRVLIAIFLLFIGIVVFLILFFAGGLFEESSSTTTSNDSDFPIVIFVPIFFGAIIPLVAAIRKRR